jgi:hypothetical protein
MPLISYCCFEKGSGLSRVQDVRPRYEALSYTWGPRLPCYHVNWGTRNGETISITQNLDIALRHLRHGQVLRTVWIGALYTNKRARKRKRDM